MIMPNYLNAEEMENVNFLWIETEDLADLLIDFELPLYAEAPPPPYRMEEPPPPASPKSSIGSLFLPLVWFIWHDCAGAYIGLSK